MVRERSLRSREALYRGIPQRYITKWLEKAVRRALLDEVPPHSLIFVSSDEDNWNLLRAERQFSLKIRPRHARHR
jgi:hypothetical protein